jgi:hypothetical protein
MPRCCLAEPPAVTDPHANLSWLGVDPVVLVEDGGELLGGHLVEAVLPAGLRGAIEHRPAGCEG